MKKIACIGTGNMGGAIARTIARAASEYSICISNRTLQHSQALAGELSCEAVESNSACAEGADFVFIGVKPPDVEAVLKEIAPVLKPEQVIVSMAAGVTLRQLRSCIPCGYPVRIFPNVACAVGRGLVTLAPCDELPAELLTELLALLKPCGLCDRTDEAHADAAMTIGGCTPAYTALFLEALADGGVAAGLKREDALRWATQAVAGSAELVLRGGMHPGQLKDAVCSPGGSTIEGVKALEKHAFRSAVMDAVEASVKKNGRLGGERPEKIGIYGGSFNPPHLGHMTAAIAAARQLQLDRLIMIPAGIPPHKQLSENAPAASDRLAMTKLAGEQVALQAGVPVKVSDIELLREGKSFTVDTIYQLRERFPNAELWLLMGTDMFMTFQLWRKPEEIVRLAGLCAFARSEKDGEDMFTRQKEYLLKQFPDARIITIVAPDLVEVSSTQLRASLPRGEGEYYLTPAVLGYIMRNDLYGVSCDLKHLDADRLRPIALSYLKAKRIDHVLGTEKTAVALAEQYGADAEKARVAALLHDCTKRLSMEEQLTLCEKYGIVPDELEQKALKLLHAKTGAELARDVFGVDDEIYQAILWHTTGKPAMSKLEKILYLADYIEPTRDFPGVEELRRIVYEDLDRGLLRGLEMTIEEMEEMGNPIHKNTVAARDYLKVSNE